MDHVNASAANRQQQQQHQQLQQHQQEQQQQHEHQQQFCLRWHNHQTSLLSTLPILLDQSHLTDVTISAEGRTLRAHRVVLSACSTFFLELFRTLDCANHPVIIIPGASFAAIVALLTFMYSGEVNVYEEQIPMLLNLAETLGIKGLADVQNNLQKSSKHTSTADFAKEEPEMPPSPPSPPTPSVVNPTTQTQLPLMAASTTSPLAPINPLLPPTTNKLPTPLESFFLKSLQFYPHLLPQPLNFSQTALNKTTELLAKYQQQCSLYQGALSSGMAGGGGVTTTAAGKELLSANATFTSEELLPMKTPNDDGYTPKRLCSGEKKLPTVAQQQQQHYQQQQKDIKRIDRIVESLRSGSKTPTLPQQATATQQHHLPQLTIKTYAACNYNALTPQSPHKPPPPPLMTHSWTDATQQQQQASLSHPHAAYITAEEHAKLQQHMEQYVAAAAAANRNTHNTPIAVADVKSESSSASASSSLLSLSCEKLLSAPTTPTSVAASITLTTPASPGQTAGGVGNKTPSNSKLYATCFICHKQLSNQYNLRVHLETHQNVRYACNVCSHVSRSKDALRKHVSYRHPGAPSPCEMESRRKRASKALNASSSAAVATATTIGGGAVTPLSPPPTAATPSYQMSTSSNIETGNDPQMSAVAAAQLSNAYMFLPNQFHLAAAVAAQHQQQQQQQQQQKQHDQNFQTPLTATTPTTSASSFDYGTNVATTTTTTTTQVNATSSNVSATSLPNVVSGSTNDVHIKSETDYNPPPPPHIAPLTADKFATTPHDNGATSCAASFSAAP